MQTFFTSDQHYYHKRILELGMGLGQSTKRPFSDLTDMREEMIHRHNERVGPGDLVYHLGDFSFGSVSESIAVAKRLNGNKYLVWGNHDKALRKSKEFLDQWIWTKDLAEIEVEGIKVVLCHYPMLSWNRSHHGSFHLHGHCHGSLKADPGALRVDVGVDCWDYRPASFEEIKKVMATKAFVPVDHHGARGNGH